MVKTLYQCEFNGCERTYDTEEKARECERRGIIGPDIKPGLVIDWLSNYAILAGDKTKGHARTYELTVITAELDSLDAFEKEPCFVPFRTESVASSTLEYMIQEASDVKKVEQEDFDRLSEAYDNNKTFELIRNQTKKAKLYREHSIFDVKEEVKKE